MLLTDHEILDIIKRIASLKSGYYELKDIFGDDWSEIRSPTSFGKRFKNTVKMSKFTNIKFAGIETDNHNLYGINLE